MTNRKTDFSKELGCSIMLLYKNLQADELLDGCLMVRLMDTVEGGA